MNSNIITAGGIECELARIIQSLDDLKVAFPEEQDHNYIMEEIFAWLYSDPAAIIVLGVPFKT